MRYVCTEECVNSYPKNLPLLFVSGDKDPVGENGAGVKRAAELYEKAGVCDVTVRLFMDMGYNPGFTGMAQMRAKVRRWLSWPGGGNLILPDDPEIEYRDVILVGAADWSNLFEDGECQLTFTLFDPIGWGAERVERTARFDVGGNWPTLPEIRLVAVAGTYLQVSVPSIGRGIRVDYEFAGGEAVVVDCQGETVRINDVDARDCVALASDFFALDPGEAILSTSNCTYVETRFSERWA